MPIELMRQLIENQSKELGIRAQELELQKQQDRHGFEYSQKALELKAKDQINSRDHQLGMRKTVTRIVMITIAALALIVTFALWKDKDQVAIEVIKAVVYVATGAFGGYGVASARAKSQSDDPSGRE